MLNRSQYLLLVLSGGFFLAGLEAGISSALTDERTVQCPLSDYGFIDSRVG
jgi:hypothetical protein